MKKFYIFFVIIFFLFFINICLPAEAADSKFNQGLTNTGTAAGYPVTAEQANPGNFLAKMVGGAGAMALALTGVIGMLFISYGGYIWMMSRGEEAKVEKAKAIIVNTIIALIIIYSVFAIVQLIVPLWQFVTK
jgi:predicted permease